MLPPGFSHMFTIFSSGSQDTHAKSYNIFLAEQGKYHLPLKFIYLDFVEEGKKLMLQSNTPGIYKDSALSLEEILIRALHLASVIGQKTG